MKQIAEYIKQHGQTNRIGVGYWLQLPSKVHVSKKVYACELWYIDTTGELNISCMDDSRGTSYLIQWRLASNSLRLKIKKQLNLN